jgi:tRNA pseudouridine38-40 synthase
MTNDEKRVRTGVLLTLAYDGRDFHGFALQPGVRTIAGTLLQAVRAIDPRVLQVRGASRTDAGVHARGQLVAFDTEKTIPARGWALGVNQALPDDVAVQRASLVSEGFNPRFSNVRKTYAYELHLSAVRDPLKHRRAWWVQPPIDMALLEVESSALIGTHDFAAFRSAADARENTTRTIESVLIEVALPRVVIRVTGSGFMHNMVRIIVGTLVDVARRRLPAGAIARALVDGNRRSCGITAPPDGLLLEAIDLDASVTLESWPS